jgi:hypothetical protein
MEKRPCNGELFLIIFSCNALWVGYVQNLQKAKQQLATSWNVGGGVWLGSVWMCRRWSCVVRDSPILTQEGDSLVGRIKTKCNKRPGFSK